MLTTASLVLLVVHHRFGKLGIKGMRGFECSFLKLRRYVYSVCLHTFLKGSITRCLQRLIVTGL